VPPVDDTWPDHWATVETETIKAGSSIDAYREHDHGHVVEWFDRHWALLETLVDDPDFGHIRFATFDGDELGRMREMPVVRRDGGGLVVSGP